jgi:hypothetical protein
MRFALCILLLVVVCACKQSSKIPENFDYGKIENGVYSNNFFDFEIPVPEKWIVQDKEQVKQLQKQGEELIAEKDKELAKKVKAGDISTAILLTVFRNRTDSAVASDQFNSSFVILAENLGTLSGINKGDEYLTHAKTFLQQSGYKFPSGFYSEKIGNKKFDGMDVSMNQKGTEVKQSYYSTIAKHFALSIIISFVTDEQERELKNILNRIKFE